MLAAEQLRPRPGAQRHRRGVQRDDELIEVVGESELDELLPLHRAYCDFYGTAPGDEELLALARALIAAPATEGFQLLARDVRGRAVGFTTVFWLWSGTRACRIALLNDLLVLEHARGSGVGRSLIATAADRARDGGARVLEWHTAPDNTRAQRLYDGVAGAEASTWLTYELKL